ncbi:MAG: choice-of-anchor tandem repeat GloVer-containing protein [Candidatus Korobacteraceae bacterium]
MARPEKLQSARNIGLATIVAASLWVVGIAATPQAQAQTFQVIHTFSGGADGDEPVAGPTLDAAGNLYGTTEYGGTFNHCPAFGCGVVYKLVRRGAAWLDTPIYSFTGSPDGASPYGRVIFGPDGALYGATISGGTGSCSLGGLSGCGTVFKLQPPPTACKSALCPWRETVLYSFASQDDGEFPQAEVAFDQAGDLYSTTQLGGAGPCNDGLYTGCGTVFKLTHNADGSWSKSTLYSFQSGPTDGGFPTTGVLLDQGGNIFGTTGGGGADCNQNDSACGVVYELTPSGSGWSETILHFFTGGTDGDYPSGLIFDSHGNLYGAAGGGGGGPLGGNGTVFEMTPAQGGGWNFVLQYAFNYFNNEAAGPGPLTTDAAGNIYGSSDGGGTGGTGTAYKLTASGGGWSYTTLYSFDFNGSDGFFPQGKVVLDAQGNLYGTCSTGPYPSPDAGTVWEIAP